MLIGGDVHEGAGEQILVSAPRFDGGRRIVHPIFPFQSKHRFVIWRAGRKEGDLPTAIDERRQHIVGGWARNFDTKRALALGFRADKDFDEIIRAHIEDELGGFESALVR